jgi:hypothetical protein
MSMHSSDKKRGQGDRQAASGKKQRRSGRAQDAGSEQLKRLQAGLGNQGLSQNIVSGNLTRDELLQHICERLQVIQGAQGKERSAMGREREWFKAVAKGAEGYHKPDPSRWHESAHLFKRAAHALCAGNLGRGAQLLEQAADAETAAFESVPKMVKTELDREEVASETPEAALQVNDEAGCAACDRPGELAIADKILAIQDTVQAIAPLGRPKRPWWEEEEEEEQEEEVAED